MHSRSAFQFSFASMLVGTAVLAFLAYATVNPSVWTASLAFTAALGAFLLALVRGLSTDGQSRRYLLAFSCGGYAYLAMLYLPVLDQRVGPRLVTTVGFAGVESLLYDESRERADDPLQRAMIQRGWARSYAEGNPYPPYRPHSQSPAARLLPQETWAGQVFHSVIAVLCGMVAGWVALSSRVRIGSDSKLRA